MPAKSLLYSFLQSPSPAPSGANTPSISSPLSPRRTARYSPSPGSSMDARISVRPPSLRRVISPRQTS